MPQQPSIRRQVFKEWKSVQFIYKKIIKEKNQETTNEISLVCWLKMLERRNRKAKLLKFTEYLESWNFPSFKFCLCFLCFCLVEESFYLLYRQERVMFVVEQVNTKAECEFQDFFLFIIGNNRVESEITAHKQQRQNNGLACAWNFYSVFFSLFS